MASSLKCLYEGTDLTNAAASLYTADAATRVTVTKATATNHTAGSVTLSVYILPSGVSAVADRYYVIQTKAIAAGATVDLSELRTHTLEPGDSIWALASANTSISVRISGQVVN